MDVDLHSSSSFVVCFNLLSLGCGVFLVDVRLDLLVVCFVGNGVVVGWFLLRLAFNFSSFSLCAFSLGARRGEVLLVVLILFFVVAHDVGEVLVVVLVARNLADDFAFF